MKAVYVGESDPLELINGKIYDVLSVEKEWYRIVDETGEAYLFPPEWFEIVPEKDESTAPREPDVYIDCPMLKRSIADGWCLEINLGVRGEMKKSAIKGPIDWELARTMCPDCPASYFKT